MGPRRAGSGSDRQSSGLILAIVLVPFPYAGNGYTLESLVAGDEREFGAATDGLVAEGFIAIVETALTVAEEEDAVVPVAVDEPLDEHPVDLLPEEFPRGRKRK